MIKRPFYKEVWFWLILVGFVVGIAGIIIIAATEGNRPLGIIITVLGTLAVIGGIIYVIIKGNTKTVIDTAQGQIDIEGATIENIASAGTQFNKDVYGGYKEYVNSKDFKRKFRELGYSQGRLMGTVGSGFSKGVRGLTLG